MGFFGCGRALNIRLRRRLITVESNSRRVKQREFAWRRTRQFFFRQIQLKKKTFVHNTPEDDDDDVVITCYQHFNETIHTIKYR